MIVWEPVIATDWGPPSSSLPGFVNDSRAQHYWDREHRLSAALGGVAALDALAPRRNVGFAMTGVIWDAALVYPPGSRWGAPARTLVAPVVQYRAELASALR